MSVNACACKYIITASKAQATLSTRLLNCVTMVNITIRFPVTMSVVRRNGTTASYNYNQPGERYTRTINGYVSDQIRAIEANSAGLSYDELDARVSEAVRNTIRSKQTRTNYIGAEEHYLEDEDDYDEPMTGDVEAASFGVHADTVGNMTISVDYETDNPNSPTGSIFDRLFVAWSYLRP